MKIDFNFDWLFYSGEFPGWDQTELPDSAWRRIDLPHDWCIEGRFDQKNFREAFIKDGITYPRCDSFLPRGQGIYRKHFCLSSIAGKRFYLEFEGVFRDCDLRINGRPVGSHSDGYTGFYFDITPYVKLGENVAALRVDAERSQGWWYEGGGIYRNVWLHEKPPIHIRPWGVKVSTPQVTEENAVLQYEIQLAESPENTTIPVHVELKDSDGVTIADGNGLSGKFDLTDPHLWSPETPNLYRLEVFAGEDRETVNTGFRFYEFTADRGFFLNGKPYRLGGGCLHHDFGGLGTALPDRAHEKNIEVMKSIGATIIRSAHNAASPVALDACDRLGMMVWAETRDISSPEELAAQIDRDGNHPCIILWGLANTADPQEMPRVQKLHETAKKLDPYRPTAIAMEGNGDTGVRGIADIPDISGMNGCGLGGCDDRDHALFPDRKIFISEFGSERGTRSFYQDEHSADSKVETLGDGRMMTRNGTYQNIFDQCLKYERGNAYQEDGWEHVRHRPWLNGGCIWSAIDYRGETNGWPVVQSQFGIFDMARFEKDTVWYFRKRWTDQTFIHMIPSHWNWEGHEGVTVRCWSVSNGVDYIDVYLNGKKQPGRAPYLQKGSEREQIIWYIPYEPGTLLCIGYRDGKEVCRQEYRTAGKPVSLKLTADRSVIRNDRKDVAFLTVTAVDREGVECPLADFQVKIRVNGCGRLIGLCSGDPKSHESEKGNAMKMFFGKLLAIVQNNGNSGEIKIVAEAEDLQSAELTLQTEGGISK